MDAARTYAVVVGIEHYEFERSDLDGPCEDAVQFVEWLRKNQVPAANIRLFLEPLEKNRDGFATRLQSPAVGVSYTAADSEAIPRCLESLKNGSLYKGELLYFYWGGHGIADRAGRRRLFYADTTEDTPYKHLDVASWMQRLASYGNFPTQIGYIDACANLKPQWNLGSNQVPAGPAIAVQSIFFAAAIGQRAANNNVEKSGRFSTVLRQVIATIQAQDPAWPPAPRQVIERLRERFRTDRTQMPVFYEAGDLEGNRYGDGELPASEFVEHVARQSGYAVRSLRAWAEAAAQSQVLGDAPTRDSALRLLESRAGLSSGRLGKILGDPLEDWVRTLAVAIDHDSLPALLQFMENEDPYSKALTYRIRQSHELQELDRLIDAAGLDDDEVLDAYRRTVAPLNTPALYCRNRREILDKLPLAFQPAHAEDRLRYVAELALRLSSRPQSAALRQWALDHLRAPTRAEIETRLARETADPLHHLLFWIADRKLTARLYRGREFTHVNTYKWPRVEFQPSQLDELIETRLADAEHYSQNLVVKFLVSSDYFSWSPQAILVRSPLGQAPLGSTYLTVMGWRERALGLPRTRHEEWEKHAPGVLDRAEDCAQVSLGWIAENMSPKEVGSLLRKIGAEQQAVAFDFVAPGALGTHHRTLGQAMLGGIPVLLWPCKHPADPQDIRTAVTDCANKGNLLRWHKEMKKFYESAPETWHLALFCDDPRQRPETWEYPDEL